MHGNYSKYQIEVEEDNDIAIVKLKICEKVGIPPIQQELSYRGKTLEDEEVIKLIRIFPGFVFLLCHLPPSLDSTQLLLSSEILDLKKVDPPASPQIRRRIVEEDHIKLSMMEIDQISKPDREIAGFQGTLLHSVCFRFWFFLGNCKLITLTVE